MAITIDELKKARKHYQQLLEQYHLDASTIVRLQRTPDDRDLSCLMFLDKNIKFKRNKPSESQITTQEFEDFVYEVYKNGVLVGSYKRIYGNGGKGKVAAEKFYPAEGVKVVWE